MWSSIYILYQASLQPKAKQRQRRLFATPSAKNNAPTRLIDSSNSKTGMYLSGEDSWVIVKKQRVTILVPPLPAATQSINLNPGSSQLQAMQAINNPSQLPNETCPFMHSIDEREKSMSLASKMNIQISRKMHAAQPMSKRTKIPRPEFTMGFESPVQVESFITRKDLGNFSTNTTLKHSKLVDGPISSLDRCLLLYQNLRAANLERKIQRAGGLSRWLASLGLGQFVRIFQKKSINKFQLLNLTMKNLKDMGADPVGPRRKLMHAIDCLSQPYCLKSI